MKKIKIIIYLLLAASNAAFADDYGWGGSQNNNTMDNWNRQNQINDMQRDNQRMIEQQNQQMQELQNQNYQLEQNMRRDRAIRNGNGSPNSLADELYR